MDTEPRLEEVKSHLPSSTELCLSGLKACVQPHTLLACSKPSGMGYLAAGALGSQETALVWQDQLTPEERVTRSWHSVLVVLIILPE